MKARPRIVVVGSLVFDFVAKAERLPRRGETILGEAFGMFPGGKGANQAVQAGRLGAEVFMIGRVGDDFLAERLLDSLRESDVSTEFVRRDPNVKTAACCIHVDRDGGNSIVIVPEANLACCRADIDAAANVIRSADVVLCQLEIALPAVDYAIGFAAEHGVRTILNPAPAQPLPGSLLAQISVLTPNEPEAELLSGIVTGTPGWESQVCRKFVGQGVGTAIITLAERGAFLANKEQELLMPTFPVSVVDSTAAGDAFNGALAVALAEGRSMSDAVRFANAAGALATTRAGAQPSLATRVEVERLLLVPASRSPSQSNQ
jgi:ribokinase